MLAPAVAPPATGTGGTVAVALLLAAAVVLVCPWRVVDPDTLSHLAVGRVIVESGRVPALDPFTFPAPQVRWSNPEWLGDTLLFIVHRAAGEPGLVALKLALLCLAWVLALCWARARGAPPVIAAALLLLVLLAAPARFTERNHIHGYWLLPLSGLLLEHARTRRRWLLALLPLGALWANLHGSFVLGWIVIAAALAQAVLDSRRGQRRDAAALGGVLALQPALALLGPQGVRVYDQLFDHLLGASTYRTLILEWQPPSATPAMLEQLPLHILGVVGTLSFLPRANRRQLGPFLLLVAGLMLAYAAQRFVPLLGLLAAPGVAANIGRVVGGVSPRFRAATSATVLLLALGLLAPAAWAVRVGGRPPLFERRDVPLGAAQLLSQAAPARARLFNPYNTGPWLLWLAPRVPIYIDPRNNQGAAALVRYAHELLPHPERFAAEAQRQRITLALVDLSDGHMSAVGHHLAAAAATWQLVHLDGQYGLYARRIPDNATLLARRGYAVLRAALGFEYLLQPASPTTPATPTVPVGGPPPTALATDLTRLERDGPALAEALGAYRLLLAGGRPPPALVATTTDLRPESRAADALAAALPRLPPSPGLQCYLATAYQRLGQRDAAEEVLAVARRLFPAAPCLLGLDAETARLAGDAPRRARLLRALRAAAPADHPVWSALDQRLRFQLP